MKIITKIIIAITVTFTLIIASTAWYIFNESQTQGVEKRQLVFNLEVNEEKGTLTVTDINFEANWDDIKLAGDALLPEGSIDVEDEIRFCSGLIKLYYMENNYIGGWDFGDKRDELHEIILFGDWEGEGQQIEFGINNSYNNIITNKYKYMDNISDDEGDYKTHVQNLNNGKYEIKYEQLVFDDEICSTSLYFNYTLYNATHLQMASPVTGVFWNFTRELTNESIVEILNASNKLDDCLTVFTNNYTNIKYADALLEGVKVNVTFENELTNEEIDEINETIDFDINKNDEINHMGLFYFLYVDSLRDLYDLVSIENVLKINAADPKFNDFGCL